MKKAAFLLGLFFVCCISLQAQTSQGETTTQEVKQSIATPVVDAAQKLQQAPTDGTKQIATESKTTLTSPKAGCGSASSAKSCCAGKSATESHAGCTDKSPSAAKACCASKAKAAENKKE